MKPEEIKERIKLVDIFFVEGSDSHECLIQNYCTEMTDDEEFLRSFFIEAFDFCGCGCLSMSIRFVRDILNCYEDSEDVTGFLNLNKAKEACCNDNITDFMLHWLDTVELTNHGSSVYGSWLTEKGKALRDYLKKVVEEEEE